jgi:hypothetical protein
MQHGQCLPAAADGGGQPCPGITEVGLARPARAPHPIDDQTAAHPGADCFGDHPARAGGGEFVIGIDAAIGQQHLDIALELEIPRDGRRVHDGTHRAFECRDEGGPQGLLVSGSAPGDDHFVESAGCALRGQWSAEAHQQQHGEPWRDEGK